MGYVVLLYLSTACNNIYHIQNKYYKIKMSIFIGTPTLQKKVTCAKYIPTKLLTQDNYNHDYKETIIICVFNIFLPSDI